MDDSERLGIHIHIASFVLIAMGVVDTLIGVAACIGLATSASGFAQEQGEYHAIGDGVAAMFIVLGLAVFLVAAAKGALAVLCGFGLQRGWPRVAIGALAGLSALSYGVAAPVGFLVAFDSPEAFTAGLGMGFGSLALAATVLGAAAIGSIRPAKSAGERDRM